MSVGRPVAANPIAQQPREHQREAIRDAVAAFEDHARALIVMACGTGKTLVAQRVSERVNADTTMVLAPTLALLEQLAGAWRENTTRDLRYIVVCSDEGLDRDDLDVAHLDAETRSSVVTSPELIAAFLADPSVPRLVLSTYHSAWLVRRAQVAHDAAALDLLVIDEAHRAAGRVDGMFAGALSDRALAARRRLSLTATARVFTRRSRAILTAHGSEVASMDDEESFGPVAHRLSFGAAVGRGLLADWHVIVGVTTQRQLLTAVAEAQHVPTASTDARTVAAQVMLLRAIAEHDLRRVVTFHSRIDRADDFQSTLNAARRIVGAPDEDIDCRIVHSGMHAVTRREALRALAAGKTRVLVSNARCLTEGIDVPALDAIAIVDPRRAVVDVVQAVGRVMRHAPGKERGWVIVPVVLADDDDPVAAIESSEFAGLWAVLAALRAHDERFAATARNHLAHQGDGLPLSVMSADTDSDMQQFAEHLRTRIIDTFLNARLTWDETLEVLHAYVAEQGRAIPSREDTYRGVNIGVWARAQRTAHAAGELSDDRQRRLEAIPGWTWEPLFDEQWDRSYRALERWAAAHGHARPEQADVTDDGIRIGMWVSRQRRRRTGQLENSAVLRPDQVARLQQLPGWTWRADEARWREFHALVTEYFRDHDHDPPSGATFGGRRLRPWIERQRREHASGDLPEDRASRLEATPGWTWSPGQDRFAAGYQQLLAYTRRERHSRVPIEHTENGYPLGKWVANTRSMHKRGQIPRHLEQQLEQLNDWTWSPSTDRWWQRLTDLSSYIAHHGHPPTHRADPALAQWSRAQRRRLAAGHLAEDQAHAFAQAESPTSA